MQSKASTDKLQGMTKPADKHIEFSSVQKWNLGEKKKSVIILICPSPKRHTVILNGTPQADFAPILGTENLKRIINYSWYQDPTACRLMEQHGSAPLEERNWVTERSNCVMLTTKTLFSTNQGTEKIHTHCVKTLNVKLPKKSSLFCGLHLLSHTMRRSRGL